MQYDFNQVSERRGTDSIKWNKFGEDVLPLWVADMDFQSAEPIIRALHQRVDEGFFGYAQPRLELRRVIQERVQRLYKWQVGEEEIFFLPGLVTGLNLSFLAYAASGEGVLVQPPVYHHFIRDPIIRGRAIMDPPLVPKGNTHEIDFDAFREAITERTKIFVLCNPHNPVGRVYTRQEMEKMAEICLDHNLIICSDEIHCDLVYAGYRHIPMATISPEVAASTVTLMAPSKTFNLAGLHCGLAIMQNPRLQERWKNTVAGLVPSANIMGHVAALIGYREGQEWLDQVLAYLQENRDFMYSYVGEKLTNIRMTTIEATYLAWLDCRKAGIPEKPYDFFLKEAKVALNDGAEFGRGGDGFVRLNFACPRATLTEALDRMAAALRRL